MLLSGIGISTMAQEISGVDIVNGGYRNTIYGVHKAMGLRESYEGPSKSPWSSPSILWLRLLAKNIG